MFRGEDMAFASLPSPTLTPADQCPPPLQLDDDDSCSSNGNGNGQLAAAAGGPEQQLPPRSSCKRKRSFPITPPASPDDPESSQVLARAVHVLATEAAALGSVSRLYQGDMTARSGLLRAVESIIKANEAGGKLIICGVGKSGHVGMKIVATMKSLGIGSSFLHAAEAMHGDLGDIRSVGLGFFWLPLSFGFQSLLYFLERVLLLLILFG
jgi:hypothetical protein